MEPWIRGSTCSFNLSKKKLINSKTLFCHFKSYTISTTTYVSLGTICTCAQTLLTRQTLLRGAGTNLIVRLAGLYRIPLLLKRPANESDAVATLFKFNTRSCCCHSARARDLRYRQVPAGVFNLFSLRAALFISRVSLTCVLCLRAYELTISL